MRGPGSIPTRGNIFSKFYNPNLHNIARSDRIGFKPKHPNGYLSEIFQSELCDQISQRQLLSDQSELSVLPAGGGSVNFN